MSLQIHSKQPCILMVFNIKPWEMASRPTGNGRCDITDSRNIEGTGFLWEVLDHFSMVKYYVDCIKLLLCHVIDFLYIEFLYIHYAYTMPNFLINGKVNKL